MLKKILFFSLLINLNLQADIFSDAWNSIKNAANTVADAVVNAANSVAGFAKDLFSDNQVSRSIDYGIRLAALESSKAVATGVLQATKTMASSTLIASRETAKVSLIVAEQFLDKVVQNATKGILKGSAEAAKGVIEGVKQTTTGVIEGGRWVITSTLKAVDLNEIYFKGRLTEIQQGRLGNVRIVGRAVVPFTLQATFDVSNILNNLSEVSSAVLKKFVEAIKGKSSEVETQLAPAYDFAAALAIVDAQVAKAKQAELEAQAKMAEMQKQIISVVQANREQLAQLGSAKFEELLAKINDPTFPRAKYQLAVVALKNRKDEFIKWRASQAAIATADKEKEQKLAEAEKASSAAATQQAQIAQQDINQLTEAQKAAMAKAEQDAKSKS